MLLKPRLPRALSLLCIAIPALAADPPPPLGKEIFLDKRMRYDWKAPHPTAVLILDSRVRSAWDGCLNPGGRGKPRSNAVIVHHAAGDGGDFRECEARDGLPGQCIDRVLARSPGAELALVVKERSLDSSMESGIRAAHRMGLDGKMSIDWESGPAQTVYKLSAEVFLAETGLGRISYHARHSASAGTLWEAEAAFCKEISNRLSEVFDPNLGRVFPRHRFDLNPIGILVASKGGTFLQGGYERLLGDGRVALAWAPGYLDVVNDGLEFQYLYLPILGMRYYLRREGQGWWFGGKLGYARIFEASHEDTYEANLAFLMAEVGRVWRIKAFFIHAHLDLGPGMGWMEEGWRDFGSYYSPPPDDLESGFGIRPVFEAGAGIGYAF